MKIEISIFSGNLFDKNSPNIRIQFFFLDILQNILLIFGNTLKNYYF